MLSAVIRVLIRAYQVLVSPFLHALAGPGFGCRFEPTCSAYAAEALQRHGPFRGLAMSLSRLCRCRPGSPGGFDPVQ